MTLRNTFIAISICAVMLVGGVAQSAMNDKEWIEYDRRLAQSTKPIFPEQGVVPDADTAKAIAFAVAIPIWGKKTAESELPYKAGLKGDVWTVIGDPHLHGGQTGGELIVQINRKNGAILSFLHTE